MSDVQKAMRKQATAPWVKKAEAGERAEGVDKALRAGKGDIVAGAKRLGMTADRPKMKPALNSAKCPAGVKPAKRK